MVTHLSFVILRFTSGTSHGPYQLANKAEQVAAIKAARNKTKQATLDR